MGWMAGAHAGSWQRMSASGVPGGEPMRALWGPPEMSVVILHGVEILTEELRASINIFQLFLLLWASQL